MKVTTNLNLITTDCGQQYVIDHLDQVALGILDTGGNISNPAFIPTTYSLYKTILEEEFILEITQYDNDQDILHTTYKLILGEEATPYLENGNLNLMLY